MATIISRVASESNLYPEEIRGPRRHERVCRARWMVIWLSREILGVSYPQIANALCRDHTTILHGYRRAQGIRERFPHQRHEMDRLRKELSEEFMG